MKLPFEIKYFDGQVIPQFFKHPAGYATTEGSSPLKHPQDIDGVVYTKYKEVFQPELKGCYRLEFKIYNDFENAMKRMFKGAFDRAKKDIGVKPPMFFTVEKVSPWHGGGYIVNIYWVDALQRYENTICILSI